MESRVVQVEDCCPPDFRWLTLKRIHWEDPHGRQRVWESAERTTRRADVDGVAILAKILRKGAPPMLPVLKQYRPPVASYCLELPAGLVDADETAADAAVRELLEETGYSGRVAEVTPVCASDPGMSNANMRYVVLEVDGEAPENQGVKQQLEDGEFIEVQLVPWTGLLQHLMAEMDRTGCSVDARLLSYAWGMEHAKEAAALAVAAAAAQSRAGAQAAAAAAAAPASSAAIPVPVPQPQQAQQPEAAQPSLPGSGSASVSDSLLSQGSDRGDSVQLETHANAPLPFGSPITPAMLPPQAFESAAANGSSEALPPELALGASQHGTAGAAGAAWPPAGPDTETGPAGKWPASGGRLRRAGAMLRTAAAGGWLPFAGGAAVGAAGCFAIVSLSRGTPGSNARTI